MLDVGAAKKVCGQAGCGLEGAQQKCVWVAQRRAGVACKRRGSGIVDIMRR